jgi:hypothetical protein
MISSKNFTRQLPNHNIRSDNSLTSLRRNRNREQVTDDRLWGAGFKSYIINSTKYPLFFGIFRIEACDPRLETGALILAA